MEKNSLTQELHLNSNLMALNTFDVGYRDEE